jgi:glycosyltransferase involved in cell wall biosynthesis
MAMGKAVVSTSVGCEGLDVIHGQHLLIADEPGAFAKAVIRLLEYPAEAHELGCRARALVETAYGWNNSADRLQAFHDSVRGAHLEVAHAVAATP